MFAPLTINLTTGDGQVATTATQITTGTGDLIVKSWYDVINTTFID